jgi:hypothetical protein
MNKDSLMNFNRLADTQAMLRQGLGLVSHSNNNT